MKINSRSLLVFVWIFALTLLAWTLSQLPVKSIRFWISGLDVFQWGIWGLLNIVIIVIYVLRWHVINIGLNFIPSVLKLFFVRQAGQSISYITPGPQFGGEPLQIYWLWNDNPENGYKALISVALDRFFELWVNFVVLIAGILVLIFFSNAAATIWYYPLIVIALFIFGLMLIGILITRHEQFLIRWIKKAISRWENNSRLKGLELHLENISSDIRRFVNQQKKAFYMAIGFSVLGWLGMLVELGLILSFLDIHLTIVNFIFLVVTMRLALLLPIPGGIGTMEASIFWAFASLGLNTFDVIGMIALIRLRDLIIVLFGMSVFHFLMKESVKTSLG